MDPLAVWGAITGSLGLGVAVRREVLAGRRRVRVDHGWRYGFDEKRPPRLHEMWVYVMVQNNGGRDISVDHLGWEWLEARPPLADGTSVYEAVRAEIPLEESRLLRPDGAPFKVDTVVGPLLHLVDPFEQRLRPIAYTHGGNHEWRGPEIFLLNRLPSTVDVALLRHDLDALREASERPARPGGDGPYLIVPAWAGSEEGTHLSS